MVISWDYLGSAGGRCPLADPFFQEYGITRNTQSHNHTHRHTHTHTQTLSFVQPMYERVGQGLGNVGYMLWGSWRLSREVTQHFEFQLLHGFGMSAFGCSGWQKGVGYSHADVMQRLASVSSGGSPPVVASCNSSPFLSPSTGSAMTDVMDYDGASRGRIPRRLSVLVGEELAVVPSERLCGVAEREDHRCQSEPGPHPLMGCLQRRVLQHGLAPGQSELTALQGGDVCQGGITVQGLRHITAAAIK